MCPEADQYRMRCVARRRHEAPTATFRHQQVHKPRLAARELRNCVRNQHEHRLAFERTTEAERYVHARRAERSAVGNRAPVLVVLRHLHAQH